MSRSALPRVQVDCQADENSRRIAEILAISEFAEGVDSSAGENIDVIVTDRAAPDRTAHCGAGETAVLGIGATPEVDAQLPLDFTARELQIAVGLAARLTATRRERNAVDRARERSALLAETDPLTGLPNRRAWERRMSELAKRDERRAWVALADLDNFKAVNDRLGMAAGDRVLGRAARALAEGLRREDLVARLGGDEFGLLIADVNERQIDEILERLRAKLSAAGEVTASIGYAEFTLDRSPKSPLDAAELATRRAKNDGGNRVCRELKA